jgi:SAM-dependent methyltransferase
VDCVISNCVINLAADKGAVFREIARILKPGGRLAVSDIALKQALPEELAANLMAYVGCIAGAIFVTDYERGLLSAGFADVRIVDSGADLNAYANVENQVGCCSPAMAGESGNAEVCCPPAPAESSGATLHAGLANLLKRFNVNDYAASIRVYAVKPIA